MNKHCQSQQMKWSYSSVCDRITSTKLAFPQEAAKKKKSTNIYITIVFTHWKKKQHSIVILEKREQKINEPYCCSRDTL